VELHSFSPHTPSWPAQGQLCLYLSNYPQSVITPACNLITFSHFTREYYAWAIGRYQEGGGLHFGAMLCLTWKDWVKLRMTSERTESVKAGLRTGQPQTKNEAPRSNPDLLGATKTNDRWNTAVLTTNKLKCCWKGWGCREGRWLGSWRQVQSTSAPSMFRVQCGERSERKTSRGEDKN
jgi:hypothetical protein